MSFRNRHLTYIDGFAGPGEYKNHPEGSPLAALKAFKDAKAQSNAWIAGDIRMLLIEKDIDRCQHLESLLASKSELSGINFKCQCVDFISGIGLAEQYFGRAFVTNDPLLVFVDPFGATGAPFNVIKKILSSKTSEVIINFDADGIARIWSSGEASRASTILTSIFGSEIWKTVPWDTLTHRQRCFECARLYKKCLFSIPGVEYAFTFEMGQSNKRFDYFLIFASQSERGLEKMKEVMKSIDQTGDFKFYDTLVDQRHLFRFDQPEFWLEPLLAEFSGRTVPFSHVKKWVLNETPFFTFKTTILKPAAEKGLLRAIPKHGCRIGNGQFPEDKLEGIQFSEVKNA